MDSLTALFITASMQFNLPPGLLESLCYVESNHRIEAIHENDGVSNSIGICQIKQNTAKQLGWTGTEQALFSPRENIYFAAAYLSHQQKRYHGNIEKAVIAYNRGHAADITHTAYSRKVLARWKEVQHANNYVSLSP